MVEFQRTQERELTTVSPVKICVVGVGGGGLNVLDRISLDRLMEASLVTMHTDVRVLGHSMTPVKIQLGVEIMRGIGSGGDPELGRDAALASREQIQAALKGHDLVFICAGLGGGTGSGAAPVVADIAKELGSMTFVFATMPFSFEGRRRLKQAEIALEELQRSADALILFENNRMGELVLPKEGIQKAFSQADQLIGHSVRAISTMVAQPGIVRMGLSDIMAALHSPNARCLFGFGEARGNNRVGEVVKRALSSPLVNQGLMLQNARNLLVHVAGGESLTLAEVEALMKLLSKHVPEHTQIMFGLSIDAKLGDLMTLTLISSLSAQDMALGSPPQSVEPKAILRPVTAPEVEPAKPAPVEVKKEEETPSVPVQVRQAEPDRPIVIVLNSTKSEREEVTSPEPLLELPPARKIHEPVPVIVAKTPDLFVESYKAEPITTTLPVRSVEEITSEIQPMKSEGFFDTLTEAAPKLEPLPIVRKEESIKTEAVIEIRITPKETPYVPEMTAAFQPLPPENGEDEDPPAIVKHSIFSVVEDDEEADERDESSAHWADKYIQVNPPQPQETIASQISSPPAVIESAKSPQFDQVQVKIKPPAEPQQPTLNLAQDNVARFKGTDKTVVEGEDLDVPTWMRLRQKLKK
ncbi:hypothetical protein BH11VER1_BH11VER1_08990 [soil metagenome]